VFPSFPAPAYFELASARMGYANNYISSWVCFYERTKAR
jgi:hypothetical protein